MTTPPLVGVVVLNWNGKLHLPQCLSSLQNLRYERFFIVVVDNGSTDDSLALAKQQFPRCHYIEHAENRGFAAGMNSGIVEALARGAQWVWIFNNDARADEQALHWLMKAGNENETIGVLSPWIIDTVTQKLWFGKGNIDWLRMRVLHIQPRRTERLELAYESQFLTGCALCIKREVIEKIGYLDERFFLYYEDADFVYRARQAGYQSFVVPHARVWHAEQSATHEKKLYYLVLSGLLFFQKHARGWQKPYLFLYTGLRRWKNRLQLLRHEKHAQIVHQAYTDFYHGS